jgi:predicted CoA-binding protein
MRLWIKILLLGVLSVTVVNAQSDRAFRIQEMQSEARVALVIGNGAYDGSKLNKLKNPTNDSYDIKELLKRKGFEVIYVEDASQEEMDRSVDTFLNKLKSKKAIGMFYYAGHGAEVKGENYLIPIGANIPDETSIKYRTLAVNRVVDGMKDAKNRLNIIILDACRNNPYKNTRGGNGGLAEISDADGIFIAYATDKGKTAEDGRGRNGLFTTHLLKYMDTEGLTIEQMFKSVRKAVREESDGFQIPWQSSSIEGDFYFTLPKVQVATQIVQQVQKVEQVVKPVVVQEVVKPIIPKEVVVIDGLWYQNQPFSQQDKENYDNQVEGGRVWTWDGAKNYCDNLTLGGKSDWRLPTREELMKLGSVKLYHSDGDYKNFDEWKVLHLEKWNKWFENNKHKRIKNVKGYEYFIRQEFVENMPPLNGTYKNVAFWSITENNISSSSAWSVHFNDGLDDWYGKSGEGCALCVRGQ